MLRVTVFILLVIVALTEAAAAPKDGRIVGGRESSITKHPHQVTIRLKTCAECPYSHYCGGVIYNERTILTAAHCVYKRDAKSFVIVAGTDNRSGSDGIVALVDKIILHEDYDSALIENDIAMMFLSTPLVLNKITVWPATLASVQPKAGSVAVVTGWGATSESGATSNTLQEVNVNIVDSAACDAAYGYNRINENMLCAGYAAGGRDACQNDSGGPLMSGELLVGIVSFGTGCGRPEFPGVYANVAYFKNWIENVDSENAKKM